MPPPLNGAEQFFAKHELQTLIDALRQRGYRVLGPVIDQAAIVYDELRSIEQLPRGWTDEQAPGLYRMHKRGDDAWFGFTVGPHSWKRELFPPRSDLLTVTPTETGWSFVPADIEATPRALIGVRACELAAIAIQDRVFLQGPYVDPIYQARRQQLFLVAVNCTQASSSCFCASMDSGPRCHSGFDLALSELPDGFVVQVGTIAGEDLLTACATRPATPEESAAAGAARQQAIDQQTRSMPTDNLPQRLFQVLDHPRWKETGDRCLSCTNCTLVCPTCFCSSVQDVRDLNTGTVVRERTWDSCFNPDFSYLGGELVRPDTASRYRQWLTHKLAGWHDQFQASGCVGCGRCITWCPVGIELTEEVAALLDEPTP